MLTEMCQILILRSQDVSKEILPDLVRKDVAEFSDVFPFSVCSSGYVQGDIIIQC